MIRSFITQYFEMVLNVAFVFFVLVALASCVSAAINVGGFMGVLTFFSSFLVSVSLLVLFFGVVYTLLDIRHNVTAIADAKGKS